VGGVVVDVRKAVAEIAPTGSAKQILELSSVHQSLRRPYYQWEWEGDSG
jgi:hypothetical protein